MGDNERNSPNSETIKSEVNVENIGVISSEGSNTEGSSQDNNTKKSILIHSQIIIKPATCKNVNEIEDLKGSSELNSENMKPVQETDTNFVTNECEETSLSQTQTKLSLVQVKSDNNSDDNNLTNNVFNNIEQPLFEKQIPIDSAPEIPSLINESILSNEDKTSKMETSTEILTCMNIKNTSLGYLQSQYSNSGSETDSECDSVSDKTKPDSESDDSSSDSEPVIVNDQEYRNQIVEINSDISSSDSDVELVHEEVRKKIVEFEANEDDIEDEGENTVGVKKHNDPLRVKGELLIHELPPIQDLQITVAEEECVELGKINSIVDQLVLVDSIPGTIPLNLDTVLFLEKGQKVLGEVFDVLGQVTNPLYCVRFNSNKQISEKGIEIGQTVYVAPRTEHTHIVILSEIMKVRGSDASWKNDVEPSPRHIDFSDDEEERSYRRSLGNRDNNNRTEENVEERKRQRTFSSASSQMSDSSSMSTQSNYYGRDRGNNRYPRPRRAHGRQFQPRNQPIYNNVRLQNPPSYNYDQFNNTWHANYNFNNPNYQSQNYRNRNNQNFRQNQRTDQLHGINSNYNHRDIQEYNNFNQQPLNFNQNMPENGSHSIYPNPYAVRPQFIPPNIMQQPLFPPPPPSNQEN